MSPTRQLVAVMFTDIVGYTALMGYDEHKALELLVINRQIQIPIIEEFNGKFIKELGDGILACFPTASDSLFAAMKIQQACSASKVLSLRIGIHEGETTFENNDIFGDAVNIASRIQTLGIPGSILFSRKIKDEVKNKTEFQSVSLGIFEFRNVIDPIEVFALANDDFPIPDRNRIDGKLKENNNQNVNKSKTKGFRRKWYTNIYNYIFSFLVICSLLAFLFGLNRLGNFWGIGNSKREQTKLYVENAVKHIDKKEYEEAKEELQLALSTDPKYAPAWSTLAAVSVRQGMLNDAVVQTLEAIRLDPANVKAAYNLAYALDDKKDSHQAIIWYSKAIQLDSAFIPAYSALGNLYNRLDQPVDAILILTLAKDKYPKSEYLYLVYKNLGNAFLLQDQSDEAIKYLELSWKINPNEIETNLYLARAYEAVGIIDRSIDLWQNYIELETDSSKIKAAKIHLKEITMKYLHKDHK